jgi:lipopolysaccharide transport system ATP-binding protein
MIEVNSLSKVYRLYARPIDRLWDWLTPHSVRPYREFWALRDVNFAIPRGTVVGIIGPNGAGKSTLLKILSGTTKQTNGSFAVGGRVAALLELGMGFHSEFTGRQNILLNGRLLGLTDEEMHERMGEIISFSELADFVDQPLRTYSSGMYVRLGFAVASCVNPDVLVVDEALAVGDAHFQQKCVRRIKEFKENGVTILFVSHDPGVVKTLCDEAMLFDEGTLLERGAPDEVLDSYNALLASKSTRQSSFVIERVATERRPVRRSGNFLVLIYDARILNQRGEEVSAVVSGQEVGIRLKVFFLDDVTNPTIGILIKDRLGYEIFGTNTFMQGLELGAFRAGETLTIEFKLALNIGAGQYTLTAAAHTLDVHLYECYDWVDKILLFSVVPSSDVQFYGAAKLYPRIQTEHGALPAIEAHQMIQTLFADAPTRLGMERANQKFLCKGWYEPEGDEENPFRWTEKGFAFFIRAAGAQLRFDVACTKPDIETQPVEAKVFAGEKKLGDFDVRSKSYEQMTIAIPEELQNQVVLFTVKLDSAWSPAEYDPRSEDRRRLGILLRQIEAL